MPTCIRCRKPAPYPIRGGAGHGPTRVLYFFKKGKLTKLGIIHVACIAEIRAASRVGPAR